MATVDENLEGDKLLFDSSPKKKPKKIEVRIEEKPETSESRKRRLIERHDSGISFNYKILNSFFYERIVYISIIIILIFLLFFMNPINIGLGDDNASSSQNVSTANNAATPKASATLGTATQKPTASSTSKLTRWGIVDSQCQLVDLVLYEGKTYSTEADCQSNIGKASSGTLATASATPSASADASASATSSATAATETTCSGTLTVSIDDIDAEDKRINSVDIEITNGANQDLSSFYLYLNYLEPDSKAYVKLLKADDNNDGKVAYTAKKYAKCGGKGTISLDEELTTHYVSTRDEDVKFEVRLYSYPTGETVLAKATYTLDALD